jgi:hypothetical protein
VFKDRTGYQFHFVLQTICLMPSVTSLLSVFVVLPSGAFRLMERFGGQLFLPAPSKSFCYRSFLSFFDVQTIQFRLFGVERRAGFAAFVFVVRPNLSIPLDKYCFLFQDEYPVRTFKHLYGCPSLRPESSWRSWIPERSEGQSCSK